VGTPKLTHHARQRCLEMGVTTKRVKRMVRQPDVDRPSRGRRRIAVRDDDPAIACVYEQDEPPLVITVLWRTQELYERHGRTGAAMN
jgi:hypothetical protein